MGRPKHDPQIPQHDNIKKLLTAPDVCTPICILNSETLNNSVNEKKVKKEVRHYYSETYDPSSEKNQCGRVWFLVKKRRKSSEHLESLESLEVLQVAQSIGYAKNQNKGFLSEICSHIEDMFKKENNNIYGAFAEEITEDEELIFYELDIEKYLNTFAPPDYKDFIYRMAREYFAEASVAHFTQAREWGFYNSGMDKRALYYLYENIRAKEIDKQREEDNHKAPDPAEKIQL